MRMVGGRDRTYSICSSGFFGDQAPRSCYSLQLAPTHSRAAARPSTDRDLVNSVNVIDERAREVMVDVIERVARLEAAVFKQGNDADPFSGK